MMYQIVTRKDGADRWQFVAHGAAYTKDEAEAYKDRASARGDAVRLLPVPSRQT